MPRVPSQPLQLQGAGSSHGQGKDSGSSSSFLGQSTEPGVLQHLWVPVEPRLAQEIIPSRAPWFWGLPVLGLECSVPCRWLGEGTGGTVQALQCSWQ